MSPGPGTPRATYRLQLDPGFGFDAARAILPYLARLGISHVYLSPVFAARPESTHGYDVVDFGRLRPEFGGREGFDRLTSELARLGLGLIVDIVPNHMAADERNAWWTDVLANGEESRFARIFDVNWRPTVPALDGKILLPVLGDHYGNVLKRGELKLLFSPAHGTFQVGYFERRFPVALRDQALLLREAARLREGRHTAVALSDLANRIEAAARGGLVAHTGALLDELRSLARDAHTLEALQQVATSVNRSAGMGDEADRLHVLLERQYYRLAFWRIAPYEINYRRFFEINDLVAVHAEDPEVFELCHGLIGALIAEGKVEGLRIDHIDGLRDPEAYLRRLRQFVDARISYDALRDFQLIVEKILEPGEKLPPSWPVNGTTGYDFMNEVNALFVEPASKKAITQCYEDFIGDTRGFAEIVREAKRLVLETSFPGPLNEIAGRLTRLAKRSRDARDFPARDFREALASIAVCFPVYRTYISIKGESPEDTVRLDEAVAAAVSSCTSIDPAVFRFVRAALGGRLRPEGAAQGGPGEGLEISQRFQQLTGPLMAKAVEDTALYRYPRLLSLNEVGGAPDRFGTRVEAFHQANAARMATHPRTLLATATHDHKRGEDVRARINVFSEIPELWAEKVNFWHCLNTPHRRTVDATPAPSAIDEYIYYQTLVGIWPPDADPANGMELRILEDRLSAYLVKAAREAKLRTSWTKVNTAYEQALAAFAGATLDPSQNGVFLEDLHCFVNQIAPAGAVNSLSQTFLKLTAPGIPDIYQGTEFWDHSLVDPDNRRPVDFESRERALAESAPSQAAAEALLAAWKDGRIKQYVIARVLAVRREWPDLFLHGDYSPLAVFGEHAKRVIAFARTTPGAVFLAVSPRLVWPLMHNRRIPLPQGWGNTAISLPDHFSGRRYRNGLTGEAFDTASGEPIYLERVLSRLPVALLVAPP